MRGFLMRVFPRLILSGYHVNESTVVAAFDLELNLTVSFCIQGVVLATTDILTGMELGATLTNQNVTRDHNLTAKFLNAKAFGF